MPKFPYINPSLKPKRIEKLSKSQQESLVFDLINAFALVKNPLDSSLLLQDLLTSAEIKNISKRLGIARLILQGATHEEITKELHCSFGTVAKVQAWLEEAGDGLKKIVKKLPKRKVRHELKKGMLGFYGLPQVLITSYLNALETQERKRVENLLNQSKKKEEIIKAIQSVIDEEYISRDRPRHGS